MSIVVVAPLNAGFRARADRYDNRGKMPEGFPVRRERISALVKEYGTDLRTAARQFAAAPSVGSSVIPGAAQPARDREYRLGSSPGIFGSRAGLLIPNFSQRAARAVDRVGLRQRDGGDVAVGLRAFAG